MSDTEQKEPGKVSKFFSTVFGWPARLSFAGRVGWIVALFLVAVTIAVWTTFLLDSTNVAWRHSLSLGRALLVLALLVLIPWIVYWAVRLWMRGEEREFPDIDYAFEAGLQALEENGISIHSTPLFVFVGSEDEQQEQAILAASGRGLRVQAVPSGPAALHWYAYPEAVYLFCSNAGCLSAIARQVDRKRADRGDSGSLPVEIPEMVSESAPPPPSASSDSPPAAATQAPSPEPPAQGGGVRGTISVDQFLSAKPAELPAPQPPPEAARVRGTMTLSDPVTSPPPALTPAASPARPAAARGAITGAARATISLPAQEAAEQRRRFAYVCGRLAHLRAPVCPVNGIVALIPFEAIQVTPREAEDLQRAVRDEMMTGLREFQLRCPVSVLFTGLERERGFSELVRRVGRQRAAAQRFGRGYDLAALATKEDLAAFSLHVCGAFEDWIYTLFRESGALTRPGNTHLYSLLCRVRCNLKSRLTDLLAEGFGYDQDVDDEDRLLVSGCYFAATGATPDRQAFVQSMFDKLEEEQESVAWTEQALRQWRRLRILSIVGWSVSGILLIALIVHMAGLIAGG